MLTWTRSASYRITSYGLPEEKSMPTAKRRLAKAMTIVARVIVLGAAAFWFLAGFLYLIFSPLHVSDVLFAVYLVIALASCIVSWWRQWLAGILLVSVSFALGSGLGFSNPWRMSYLFISLPQYLPFFVAGILFLLSWQILKSANSPVVPPSE